MLRILSLTAIVLGLSMTTSSLSFAVGSESGSGFSSSSSSGSSYGSSSSSASSSRDGSSAFSDDPDALMAEGQRYLERGWYRRAVGSLRKATQLDPFNADAWNELGFAYRNVENYNQSARAYDRALSLEPNHLGALNYQGFMFLETNDPDSARSNLAQLGELCRSCREYQLLKDAIDKL